MKIFEILIHRALQQELELDYNEIDTKIVQVAQQWKTALLDWASERLGGRKRHDFKSMGDVLPSDVEGLNVTNIS